MRERCSIQQGDKMIAVDQSKVLKNRLFRVFWGGHPGIDIYYLHLYFFLNARFMKKFWPNSHIRRTRRVSFRGADGSHLARIFFHCLHENQEDLLEYYLIFLPKNGYLKNSRGVAAPSAPWPVRLCQLCIKFAHSLENNHVYQTGYLSNKVTDTHCVQTLNISNTVCIFFFMVQGEKKIF